MGTLGAVRFFLFPILLPLLHYNMFTFFLGFSGRQHSLVWLTASIQGPSSPPPSRAGGLDLGQKGQVQGGGHFFSPKLVPKSHSREPPGPQFFLQKKQLRFSMGLAFTPTLKLKAWPRIKGGGMVVLTPPPNLQPQNLSPTPNPKPLKCLKWQATKNANQPCSPPPPGTYWPVAIVMLRTAILPGIHLNPSDFRS